MYACGQPDEMCGWVAVGGAEPLCVQLLRARARERERERETATEWRLARMSGRTRLARTRGARVLCLCVRERQRGRLLRSVWWFWKTHVERIHRSGCSRAKTAHRLSQRTKNSHTAKRSTAAHNHGHARANSLPPNRPRDGRLPAHQDTVRPHRLPELSGPVAPTSAPSPTRRVPRRPAPSRPTSLHRSPSLPAPAGHAAALRAPRGPRHYRRRRPLYRRGARRAARPRADRPRRLRISPVDERDEAFAHLKHGPMSPSGAADHASMPSLPAHSRDQWKGRLQQSVNCIVPSSSSSPQTMHGRQSGICVKIQFFRRAVCFSQNRRTVGLARVLHVATVLVLRRHSRLYRPLGREN